MGMIKVTCQDCGREMEMNEHYAAEMFSTGELVRGNARTRVASQDRDKDGTVVDRGSLIDNFQEKVFDICRKCKTLSTPRAGDEEIQREQRIQNKVRALREYRPDLDFEQRVHAAVEEEFDPRYETNKEFRKFLLERQGL